MDHTGLSRQTLHYYTTLGLIFEKKRTAAGYRLYPPSVFRTLDKVRTLQQKGYTLGRIRETLNRSHQRTRPETASHASSTAKETVRTPRKRPSGLTAATRTGR